MHLLFADDKVLFCKASLDERHIIIEVLKARQTKPKAQHD